MSRGIDYGMGITNIDNATGIRYGVISSGEVCQAWNDSSEGDYGEPCCPKCGNPALSIDDESLPDIDNEDNWEDEGREYACLECRYSFDSSEAYGEEPLGFTLDDGKYKATQGSDGDIFILSSPYYTRASFCSPCAPGACYLTNPCDDGEKAYCFGHEWFDDEIAPYPVYRVVDGVELVATKEEVSCDKCKGSGKDSVENLCKVRGVTIETLMADDSLVSRLSNLDQKLGTFDCYLCNGKGKTEKVVVRERAIS